MGIPRFVNQFINNIDGVERLNDFPVSDTLTIDMNGLLHSAAQKSFGYGMYEDKRLQEALKTKTQDELFKIYENTLKTMMMNLVVEINPRYALIMAIDGVPPFAKITQQRYRRYRSAMEKSSGSVFDSNSITTGTKFMQTIDIAIRKWIDENKERLPPLVIYSGHRIPGEGEHKMIDIFRTNKNLQKPDMIHIFHGLDADLFILAMILIQQEVAKNIYLFREDNNKNYIYGVNSVYNTIKTRLMKNKHNAIYDFCVIMSLLGNDFLPAMASCLDLANGLSYLLRVYRKLNITLTQTEETKNNKSVKIIWKNLSSFLAEFSKNEVDLLNLTLDVKLSKVFKMKLLRQNVESNGEIDMDGYIFDWYSMALPKLDSDYLSDMLQYYLTGLQWVLTYYTSGAEKSAPTYFYPYSYGPFAGQLAEMSGDFSEDDVKEIYTQTSYGRDDLKLTIAHQLLSVLPPSSFDLIPNLLLPVTKIKKLKYMFPDKIEIDDSVSGHGVAKIPFVNLEQLDDAIRELKLTEAQKTYFEKSDNLLVVNRMKIGKP